MDTLICPRCRGRAVGRVGMAQWYCWDCCVEFGRGPRGLEVFLLDEEGERTSLDLAAEEGAAPCAGSAAAS
ncbi:MAG: hypothetical protein K6V73_09380 [Firmicutes bacterium]|jgi:hypothetical protein|nr:hypothetical protein [Bacillota bacterium]